MRGISVFLALAAALMLGGCGSGSAFPEATGKSSLRAINAIPTSPEITFLIEERAIGSAVYQNGTIPADYDDLSYTFNFEVFYPGESGFRRFASQDLDVEANRIYDFLISGSLTNPTITLWQSEERVFDEADTIFGVKFSHASATLGDLDYYFAAAGVAPTPGNERASLSFGEVSEAIELPEGDFVLTVTRAGDPGAVVFTSATVSFPARDVFMLTVFDGDASDTAPVFVRAFSDAGNAFGMPDPGFPPTIQFINGSMDLGPSDIYDDEALSSLRVADLDFLDVSAELAIPVGENTFFFTPAGGTSAVSLETLVTAFGGLNYRSIVFGAAGSLSAATFTPDARSVETHAKILPYQVSNNFEFLDLYAVEPDTGIDEALPIRGPIAVGITTPAAAVPAGTYDLYVTANGEKEILAGPYRIDVTRGDIVDLLIVDTVDPAVVDILFLSGGPDS